MLDRIILFFFFFQRKQSVLLDGTQSTEADVLSKDQEK